MPDISSMSSIRFSDKSHIENREYISTINRNNKLDNKALSSNDDMHHYRTCKRHYIK